MANKILKAAALKRNIEMTESAIATISEYRQQLGPTIPEAVEQFLVTFRQEMDAKLAKYRAELEKLALLP